MPTPHTFPLHGPLLRGSRCPCVALVGQPHVGKSRIFQAASSTVVHHERLAGVGPAYAECQVEIGLERISLVDLPPVDSLHALRQSEAAFPAPDVLLLVMDATALERDLELALELVPLGKPMVIALNRMDEARAKRLFINVRALSEKLGVPVVPTVAYMGIGLADLFSTVIRAAHQKRSPEPPRSDEAIGAVALYAAVTRPGGDAGQARWQRWADEVFLHPRWGFAGTLAIFALVLFFVFEVSAFLDSLTVARLIEWAEPWQPTDLAGILGRAVLDGFIGLTGIVIPYMIPLVLLLVLLEESGIMHRVAFVVDRGFHQIGLHGGVALPFLMGLGCNVPALAATAAVTHGRDKTVASLLITFLPCSARSAILLALGGKYLGGVGVFCLFMLTPIVVSLVGKLLKRRYPETTPGMIQEIPPYAVPTLRALLWNTWERSRDIVTIVLPLLVAGSVVLALLSHFGADAWINLALTPVTVWWLGLPAVLGVPILFGVLRKELSLLMVFQALGLQGAQDLTGVLDTTQIATFLVFLTFYVPCVSTFAMMLKLLGRREAAFSVALSVGAALIVALAVRLPLELLH